MPPPEIDLTVAEHGEGRPLVVLHGGGGPASVAPLVEHLAASHRVLAPTVPGWDGTPRPDWLDDIDDVALVMLDLLRRGDLRDVTVLGSSIGGWIGSAMAALDRDAGRIGRLVLIDAVGIAVSGQPIRDFFALDAHGVAEYSFHDGDQFYVDPAALTAQQRAAQAANMATMRVLAGDPYMHEPHLVHRIRRVEIDVLGIWGDSDRIVTPDYGRAYLDAFPHSRLEVVADAGHLPHIEQPARTFAVLDPFLTDPDRSTR